MRRLVFGLALWPIVASSSASAGGAQLATESAGSQKAQKLQSLPLSSEESYAAAHSANLPVSSGANPTVPANNSWTGVYVGAGIGAGRQ